MGTPHPAHCRTIATTYRVFSQTADEPFHLAAGYDFLKTGRQTSDFQHPPLARVLFALPFLDTPPPATTDAVARGNALLLRNDRYTQNLGRARPGNLLFLAIGIAAVGLWGRHLFSPAGGLFAALLFASPSTPRWPSRAPRPSSTFAGCGPSRSLFSAGWSSM